MGKVYDEIDEPLARFLGEQRVFFVASAPLAGDGHVNLSPKGLDTFRILDAETVAYLDLTGSGVETIAHLRENGRIVILFTAFEGPPKIVRLYGRGEVVEPGDPRFDALAARFPRFEATRAVIVVTLDRIADSCGYGVPRMRYEDERQQLLKWAERKGPEGVALYQAENNRESIDGIPGLASRTAPETGAGAVHHVFLTVNDLERSKRFYAALMPRLGYAEALDYGSVAGWASPSGSVWIKEAGREHAGAEFSKDRVGLCEVAFRAGSRRQVDALARDVAAWGGAMLDPPRDYPQYAPGYYAVFFADPDGIKLELVHLP